jgi:hypothetical protein
VTGLEPAGLAPAAGPAIFLSHSCKCRDQPGDERLQYARKVLQLIYDALRDAGFSPWLDKERLYAGDGWNAEIHYALNTCAGAVILLDPVVIEESDWVLAEATILAHRYATSADFRLVPVLLGSARPETLQRGRWAPTRLADIQPARDSPAVVLDWTHSAEDVARQVAQAFDGLVPVTANPLLKPWLDEITDLLTKLADHRLDAAAEALRIDRADWQAKGRRVDRLAYALLDGDRESIPKAVSRLAPLANELPDPVGKYLGPKVTPLWVRLEMASGIALSLRAEFSARRVLVSTRNPGLVSDIIHRAVYCSPDLRLAHCTGESGEDFDQLVANCGRSIARRLIFFGLLGDEPPGEIAAKLAHADPPPFAVISADGLDEDEMESLVDQLGRRFPGVVLVLLSSLASVAQPLSPQAVPVMEPPLTEDEARLALIFRCQILELAGQECGYE